MSFNMMAKFTRLPATRYIGINLSPPTPSHATRYIGISPSTSFLRLANRRGIHTAAKSDVDATSNDSALWGKPPQEETGQFTQPDKHATELRSDVDELKANTVIVKLHLDNLRSSVDHIKTDLKDLTNKFDRKTDDLANKLDHKADNLANKLDRKADKTDGKIDRAVYFFIAGLFLKGGFDVYMKQDKAER